MASRDDSPTSLHGQPWSVWADRLGRDSPLSDTDDQNRPQQIKEGDAMKLPKEDMSYYGLCPVRDEFYLVVCNYCHKVCTPQGLKNHIELKHAREWQPQPPEPPDSNIQSSAPVSTIATKFKSNKKIVGGTSSVPTSLAALLATPAQKSRSNKRGGTGSKSSFSHGGANSKIPTAVASALTGTPFDKIPSPQQPPPTQFSPSQPSLTAPSPVSPLTANNVITPATAITMTVAVDSCGVQTVQIHLPEIGNGLILPNSPADLVEAVGPTTGTTTVSSSRSKKRKPSKSERRLLPLKEREFDPEKHCGVWMNDIQKPCTRSLTCKAHSLTLRRAVQGRSRSFDDLLADHRAAKEALVKQLKEGVMASKETVAKDVKEPKILPSPPMTSLLKPLVTPAKPRPLPKTPPAKKPAMSSLLHPSTELNLDIPVTDSPTFGPQTGLLQRVFTSPSLSATAHHPKPLAVCSFGLRRNGHLVTVDRKWDVLRNTLRTTLQRTKINNRNTGLQSILQPSFSTASVQRDGFELTNGLQLSIGVKQAAEAHSNHRVKLKKTITNGITNLNNSHRLLHAGQQQATDLMDGFDGLVGEDGVLTFLNQGSDGAASLSLMADLTAGNITFSEMMAEPPSHLASQPSNSHPQPPVALRLVPSSSSALLLQPDPGDQM